jgi:hypothetical protein
MMDLPRERQPDPALEERVVSALVASGLVRRQRPFAPIWLAAAAVLIMAISFSWWQARRAAPRGNTYVVLLYAGSTYRNPPLGHMGEREAEYARWADSLAKLGKLDLGGKLLGGVDPNGLFIIRAQNDSDAAAIAATCPHMKYGGHLQVRRFIE